MSGFFPDAARSGAGVTEGNVRQWDSAAPTVKDLGVGDGVENRCWARVSDVLVAVARGGGRGTGAGTGTALSER